MLLKLLIYALLLFFHGVYPQTATNNFLKAPTSVTTILGDRAEFHCQLRRDIDALIGWAVNGQPPNSLYTVIGNGTLSMLVITNVTIIHNNTNILCMAQQPRGIELVLLGETDRVKILLQGTLQPVTNLSRSASTISWSPPFSLDLTNIEPDIVYCVEVYNITCGRRDLIIRDCNVIESSYVFDSSGGFIYEYIVTPRSNVSGASNGIPNKVTEQWICLNDSQWQWRVFMDKKHLTLNLGVCSSETQSGAPVPSYYKLILESLDGLNNNIIITNIALERNGEMVEVHVEESIPPNSLWRASILAYGCESDRIVTNYELSTHNIQNIVVHPSLPGRISVTGELIDRSTTGVLIVVYSLTNSSNDVHYVAKHVNDDNIILNVTGLTGAEYGVSIFALENGLPLPGVVASPRSVAVQNSHQDREQQQPPTIEYEIINTSPSVCITCTFLESSATGCVAVVHQRISQLNSSGLMSINSSYKFTRSGDTAHECIEGVNLEQYQVGVIGGKVVTSTVQSNDKGSSLSPGAVAGIVLAITTFILIAVVVIGIVYYYLRKRWKVIKLGPLEVGIAPPCLKSDTVVSKNIANDSGFHHYAESAVPLRAEETEGDTSAEEESPPLPPRSEESLVAPPLPPRSEESMMLVEVDSASHDTIKESAPPPPGGPPDQDSSKDSSSDPTYAQPELTRKVAVPPPGPPAEDSSKDGSSDPTYAQPEFTRKLVVPPPAATEKLVYDDIHGFQNKEGQTYALPQLSASNKAVDDLHKVVYSEIQPKIQDGATSTEPDCTAEETCGTGTPPSPTPAQPEVTVSPPADTKKQVYDDIHGFQNQEGQTYAMTQLPPSEKVVDDFHKVMYSEVQPKTGGKATSTALDHTAEQACETGIPQPLTFQQLYYHLLSLSSKWRSLGEALSFDKDQLEEIFTSDDTETDEDCLQKMLEFYTMRSGYSWEEIYSAETKVKEKAVELNQGGCGITPQESGKEQAEMEFHQADSVHQSPRVLLPYHDGSNPGELPLSECSKPLDALPDDVPLTSTPKSKTDAKKPTSISSPIAPRKLNYSDVSGDKATTTGESGGTQTAAHDTDFEKIFAINGIVRGKCEQESQGKTHRVIQDDSMTDDVAIGDLSHENSMTHEPYAIKHSSSSMSPSQTLSHLSAVDLEKGSSHESGYVSLTLVSASGTTDNVESSSVNSDDTGSDLKETIIPEPTSNLVYSSVKSQAMEEQSEVGSVPLISQEETEFEDQHDCKYFSTSFEGSPQDVGEQSLLRICNNKPGQDTKNVSDNGE